MARPNQIDLAALEREVTHPSRRKRDLRYEIDKILEECNDCYLYSRVSTIVQLDGMGLELQTKKMTEYMEKRPHLVIKGTFKDLGISAWKGDNVISGEMGQFMKLVEDRKIKPGSRLIMLHMSRFSREEINKSLPAFLNLMAAGIILVTIADGQEYQRTGEAMRDFMDVVIAMVTLMLAAKESDDKSGYGLDNWQEKRLAAVTEQQLMTRMVPRFFLLNENGRARLDTHGKVQLDPAKNIIVNQMCDWFLEGAGVGVILKKLDAEPDKYPCFGSSGVWDTTYIRKILNSRALIGEFQAGYRNPDNNDRQEPLGPPAINYFPGPIVPLWKFQAVQDEMKRRSLASPHSKTRYGVIGNLFGPVARCLRCNGSMVIKSPGNKPDKYRYMNCTAKRHNRCKGAPPAVYPALEAAILKQVRMYLADDYVPPTDVLQKLTDAVAAITNELHLARPILRDAYADWYAGDKTNTTLKEFIDHKSAEIAKIEAELAVAQKHLETEQVLRPTKPGIEVAQDWIAEAASGDNDARLKIASALRSIISRVAFAEDGTVVVKIARGALYHGFKDERAVWAVVGSNRQIAFAPGLPGTRERPQSDLDAICVLLDRVDAMPQKGIATVTNDKIFQRMGLRPFDGSEPAFSGHERQPTNRSAKRGPYRKRQPKPSVVYKPNPSVVREQMA